MGDEDIQDEDDFFGQIGGGQLISCIIAKNRAKELIQEMNIRDKVWELYGRDGVSLSVTIPFPDGVRGIRLTDPFSIEDLESKITWDVVKQNIESILINDVLDVFVDHIEIYINMKDGNALDSVTVWFDDEALM